MPKRRSTAGAGPFAGFCLAIALLFAVAGASAAANDPSAEASAFVREVSAEAVATLALPDREERKLRFRSLFVRAFAVPAIGRYVLGAYWNKITAGQQEQFLRIFEDYVVANYTAKPWDMKDVQVGVVSAAALGDNDVAVETRMHVPKQDKPILVGWRILSTAGTPQIVDLKVDGVSLVVSQRSEFTSILRQKNEDFAAFIDVVAARTRQLDALARAQKAAAP